MHQKPCSINAIRANLDGIWTKPMDDDGTMLPCCHEAIGLDSYTLLLQNCATIDRRSSLHTPVHEVMDRRWPDSCTKGPPCYFIFRGSRTRSSGMRCAYICSVKGLSVQLLIFPEKNLRTVKGYAFLMSDAVAINFANFICFSIPRTSISTLWREAPAHDHMTTVFPFPAREKALVLNSRRILRNNNGVTLKVQTWAVPRVLCSQRRQSERRSGRGIPLVAIGMHSLLQATTGRLHQIRNLWSYSHWRSCEVVFCSKKSMPGLLEYIVLNFFSIIHNCAWFSNLDS